jgi:predicted transcriptional regulator
MEDVPRLGRVRQERRPDLRRLLDDGPLDGGGRQVAGLVDGVELDPLPLEGLATGLLLGEAVRQRWEVALRLAANPGGVRSGQLATACGISAELARQTLAALADAGLLCRVGGGRGTRYQTLRGSGS